MVTADEIEQAKQDIDIRTFRQEFEGTFENYAGSVYYNFHPVDNVVKKQINWEKPLHIGMDFNVDPMSACVAQLEQDKIFFLDEVIIYGSNTDEMVQELRDRYGTRFQYLYILTQLLNSVRLLLVVELIYLFYRTLDLKLR